MPEILDLAVCLASWRADLSALYNNIRAWAGEMQPPPAVSTRQVTLNEYLSGPYEVEELILARHGHQMIAHPVGFWTMGADGRVDLNGTEGPFILVNQRERGGWYYVADRPNLDLCPLDGPLFRRLAETCLS
jgi:hypothetical protein